MDKVGPALATRLESAADHDSFEVTIFLRGEPAQDVQMDAADDSPADRDTVVSRLQASAESRQAPLLDFLAQDASNALMFDDGVGVPMVNNVRQFWINNAVVAEVTRPMLEQILAREDVDHVELVRHASEAELFDDEQGSTPKVVGVQPLPGFDAVGTSAPTWSVTRVNAPLLWAKGITGDGVIVAVVDGGVNYRHPDLKNRMWTSADYPNYGYDFADRDDDPMDPIGGVPPGHGTSCAGIVAGDGAEGKATGVAPEARIMAIRVAGSEPQFWEALQFAVAKGAHVISMSMTWKPADQSNYPGWRRTCESIRAAGVLHANSSGNQGDRADYALPYNIRPPGSCPPPRLHPTQPTMGGLSSAISCGSTSDTDELASNSGRGPVAWESGEFADYPYAGGAQPGLIKPDICAPGVGTVTCNFLYGVSALAKPYVGFTGTSAATPHLGGCLALLASACLQNGKPIVPALVQEAIENTAVRIKGQTQAKENHFGAGRIDVYAAHAYGVARGWW